MNSVLLSKKTANTALVLFVLLIGANVWLAHRVRLQSKALDTFGAIEATTRPMVGQAIPILSGKRLNNGEDYFLAPSSSPPFALLVFREACGFCEANWKNWDSLFQNSLLHVPVILISPDKAISEAYRMRHPLLNGSHVMIGTNPDTLASLKLETTPQTIFVVDGKVKRDWVGVLDDADLREVRSTMPHD